MNHLDAIAASPAGSARSAKRWVAALIVAALVTPVVADESPPDPRSLLERIERDRLAFGPGRIELILIDMPTRDVDGPPVRTRLVVTFEGERRRFDADLSWLEIPWLRPESGPIANKTRSLEGLLGGQAAIVDAGLGVRRGERRRTIYDGHQVMNYLSGNRTAVIADLKGWPARDAFDPRILGLSADLSPSETVRLRLAPRPSETVRLVGREDIAASPAWHVLVGGSPDRPDLERHFWVHASPTCRLLRHEIRTRLGRSEVVSEYGALDDDCPLPTRITSRHFDANGIQDRGWSIEREETRNGIPVDPSTWTLAGLEMPAGVAVTDRRGKQSLGFWDGRSLTKAPPPANQDEPPSFRPDPSQLLRIARLDRDGPLAFDALAEIARSAPSGTEAGDAVRWLTSHHAESAGVGEIALRFAGSHPEGVEPLFRSILAGNPAREDRGHACFGLAQILKERSGRRGQDCPEAERLFERAITTYGDVKRPGWARTIGESARSELDEMQALGIGKLAPDIVGEDLRSRPLSLGDFRGKVVVVDFWNSGCAPCLRAIPGHKELIARMDRKPFVLLGVCGDEDRTQAIRTAANQAMTWPSWWQGGGDGPITRDWRVHSWASNYVIDARGIIRFKNLNGPPLREAVESLVEEALRP
ncbi:TlpA family protein disulfide reductase [Tundrisphaera sp. TA3]|uniref:TlpA family protein disulfide reductase n=1 Tax=Tundrisphaera sp. TA3 TaxID=3435775 RepID=UPI003EB7E90F